jgi:hypothetical protein
MYGGEENVRVVIFGDFRLDSWFVSYKRKERRGTYNCLGDRVWWPWDNKFGSFSFIRKRLCGGGVPNQL